MKQWQQENLNDILGCTTQDEVFQTLKNETRRLGMDNVSWVIKLPIPLNKNRMFTFDTYSTEWHERYFSQNYLSVDPTVKHGLTSMRPQSWSSSHHLARDFWDDAFAHGLQIGCAQSIWDRHGCVSMLSLSRDSLEFSPSELSEKIQRMSFLAQLAHIGMSHLILQREVPETAVDLTKREKELLQLAACGISSQEIADQLKISKRAADFHLDNARSKLGAENRTDAVVRALVLGFIDN
jgi:LuxR family quorum-sensing system transcriptional regulator SolR